MALGWLARELGIATFCNDQNHNGCTKALSVQKAVQLKMRTQLSRQSTGWLVLRSDRFQRALLSYLESAPLSHRQLELSSPSRSPRRRPRSSGRWRWPSRVFRHENRPPRHEQRRAASSAAAVASVRREYAPRASASMSPSPSQTYTRSCL